MAPVAVQTLGVGEIFPPRSVLPLLAENQLPGETTAAECTVRRVEGVTRDGSILIKSSSIFVINP